MKLKNCYLILMSLLFNLALKSQTVIYTEDFEGSDFSGYAIGNATTNADYGSQSFGGSSVDYIKRGPSASTFSFTGTISGNSTNMIGLEDIDGAGQGWNKESYLELDPVSITGIGSMSIEIDIAFPSTGSSRYSPAPIVGGANDTYFIVEYDINNTGSYTTVLAFYDDHNDASDLGMHRDDNLNGQIDAGENTFVNTTMTTFSLDLDALAASSVTGSTIEIRVRFGAGNSHDEMAFDNLTLKGMMSATPISASITTQTNVLCGGEATGALTVTAADGTTPYTYDWSNGGSSASISSLLAGTYTVTVTDGGGGTATASATITEIAAIVVTLGTPVDVDCFGASTGSLMASVTGGTTPYTYNWNSGETSSMITNKPAGTYTVYVQDANGCGDVPPP